MQIALQELQGRINHYTSFKDHKNLNVSIYLPSLVSHKSNKHEHGQREVHIDLRSYIELETA